MEEVIVKKPITLKKTPKRRTLKVEQDKELWLTISEAAKVGGVTSKTIRRAIKSDKGDTLHFKISKERYLISFPSFIKYLKQNYKLNNKFSLCGIGKYIKDWKL